MRFIPIVLGFIYSILIISPAYATEEKTDKPIDPKEMMKVYEELAKPGQPHKLFATLVGSWVTNTKEWMEPGKPPTESTGTAEMKMILGGRFLFQEISGKMMGQPFSGISIDGYDNIRKKYITTWMDSMSTGIFMMEGTASDDGRTITLTGQHQEPGGSTMKHRAIWKIIDADTQTFEMWGTHHGSQEMKMLEIRYTRKQ